MVNELRVCCPNSAKGCDLVLQRHLMIGHIQECSFRGSEAVEAGSAEEEKEQKVCPHCHENSTNLVSHIITCEEMQMTCRCNRFGCSWSGARKHLAEHSKICHYLKLESFLEKQDSRIIALENENSELRSVIISFHKDLESLFDKIENNKSSQSNSESDAQRNQNAPSTSQRYFNDLPAASLERVRADHQRLRFELMSLSSSLASLELKQNIALTTECLSLRDEVQELRYSFQSLKVDFSDMARERQSTLSALAVLAKSASNRASRSTSLSSQSNSSKKNDCKL